MVPHPLPSKKLCGCSSYGVQVNDKRKHLTISDKLKVITEFDSGKSKRSIAEIFGISDHQVRIICQNKDQLLEVKEDRTRPLRACKVYLKYIRNVCTLKRRS